MHKVHSGHGGTGNNHGLFRFAPHVGTSRQLEDGDRARLEGEGAAVVCRHLHVMHDILAIGRYRRSGLDGDVCIAVAVAVAVVA